ncbi:hypothetical protein IJG79_02485 [Candidatus Saccharibacteria bacterium]|nr:hypothetical protein [Candidatus Saccharibacteria bacterium]
MYNQGNRAYLWSFTIVSSNNAYSLNTWSTAVRPAVSDGKAIGLALRCAIQISAKKILSGLRF